MLQKSSEFIHYAHQLKIDIKNHKYFIQKIVSTPDYVFIKSRTAGSDLYFAFGRGGETSGLVIVDKFPKPSIRGIDSFHEYLKKILMGGQIESVNYLEGHKALQIQIIRASEKFGILLYWKSTKFYFCHYSFQESDLMLRKWWHRLRFEKCDALSTEKLLETVFEITSISQEAAALIVPPFDMNNYENLKEAKRVGKKLIHKNENKRRNIENDLEKIKKWKKLQEFVTLNREALLGKKAVEILGIKFKTTDLKSDYALLEKIFEKIKSLKKAQALQEKRLKEVLSSKPTESKLDSVLYAPFVEKDVTPLKIKKTDDDKPSNVEIYKFRNITCAIGLSAQGNDWIRNKWAQKDDVWFHLDGNTSAHLILKNVDKNTSVLEYTDLVATLIRSKMNLKDEVISLIYTKVKNLKSVKGKAGLVRYTEQKKIFGNNHPELLKELIKC